MTTLIQQPVNIQVEESTINSVKPAPRLRIIPSKPVKKSTRYVNNRDECLKYQKQYHADNHDKYLTYQKAYYKRTKVNKNSKTFYCDYCDKCMGKGSYTVHCRTQQHIRNKCKVKMPSVAAEDDVC